MLGGEGVVRGVLDFLAATLPARCTVLEQRLALAAGSILPPAEYSPTDLETIEDRKFPLCIGEIVDQPDMNVADHDTGDSYVFVVDYGVRVHIFYRSDVAGDVAGAELGRYRLLLAVTEAVLLTPALGSSTLKLARRRITTRPGPIFYDVPGRAISPGYLDLPVQAEEALARAPLSTAPTDTTVLTTTLT